MPDKPPRARIRRVFDARPLAELPRPLKVRPFIECFDRGSGLSGLLIQGQLAGTHFEVSIGDRERVVLRGTASEDAHGPFALLEAQEHPIGRSHALRVDADAEDADSNHAAISYFELPDDLVARLELAYSERWYSVYFNPLGMVDGSSSCAPRSIAPPASRLS
jgi:hypothetical protein